MRTSLFIVALAPAMVASACSRGGPDVGPTPIVPPVVVSPTGPTLVRVEGSAEVTRLVMGGQCRQTRLTAVYSDESRVDVTEAGRDWLSSASAVEVSPSGMACPRAPGRASVSGAYEGRTAVVDFTVVESTVTTPPTVDIKADGSDGPIAVNYGSNVSITWSSTNAEACNINGTPVSTSGASGDVLTSSRTYKFGCTGLGGSASDSVTVNVNPPPLPPTTASITPSTGSTGGGTPVTITGTGFRPGATVTFGVVAANGVVVVSATRITALAPAHAAGTVDVVVTNPDGQSARLSGAYTYAPPPPTTASLRCTVSSSSGQRIGGAKVTVLDGPNTGQFVLANGNGECQFDSLAIGNVNFSATASGFTEDRRGTYVNGNTLDFVLTPANYAGTWVGNGTGLASDGSPVSVEIELHVVGEVGNFAIDLWKVSYRFRDLTPPRPNWCYRNSPFTDRVRVPVVENSFSQTMGQMDVFTYTPTALKGTFPSANNIKGEVTLVRTSYGGYRECPVSATVSWSGTKR